MPTHPRPPYPNALVLGLLFLSTLVRAQSDARKKYVSESKEFKSLLKKMRQADSINLLNVQEKYLPLMREAVNNGKALAASLAIQKRSS